MKSQRQQYPEERSFDAMMAVMDTAEVTGENFTLDVAEYEKYNADHPVKL